MDCWERRRRKDGWSDPGTCTGKKEEEEEFVVGEWEEEKRRFNESAIASPPPPPKTTATRERKGFDSRMQREGVCDSPRSDPDTLLL